MASELVVTSSPERVRVQVAGTPQRMATAPSPYRNINFEAPHEMNVSPAKGMRDAMLGGTPVQLPVDQNVEQVIDFSPYDSEPQKGVFTANHTSILLILWQVVMVILFITTTTFAADYMPVAGAAATSTSTGAHYPMFQDTHIMMGIGFGFLYTLLRRYAWTGVGLNFLLCACTYQWAILCNGFWDNVRLLITGDHTTFLPTPLNLEALINGDYVVATILISFGALLGRLSPTQALWMAFIETIVVTANVSLCIYFGVNDAGELSSQ